MRPRYADRPGEPGHPVLLHRQLWPEVATLEGDEGAGALLRGRAVTLVDVPGRNPDIDTPADLAAFPVVEKHLMRLSFSGSTEVSAPPEVVWQRLIDPEFVASAAPGVERVEKLDGSRFTVFSAFGLGAIKLYFTLDVELLEVLAPRQVTMRAQGKAPGSVADVTTSIELAEAVADGTTMNWHSECDVSGILASVGGHLLEGTARKLTEQFWLDFAARCARAD